MRAKAIVFEKKETFKLGVFPYSWSYSLPIFAQFGVVGDNANQHVTTLELSIQHSHNSRGVFEVELTGGDKTIRGLGPGDFSVTITGNAATEILLRCKSNDASELDLLIITKRYPLENTY